MHQVARDSSRKKTKKKHRYNVLLTTYQRCVTFQFTLRPMVYKLNVGSESILHDYPLTDIDRGLAYCFTHGSKSKLHKDPMKNFYVILRLKGIDNNGVRIQIALFSKKRLKQFCT